MGGVSPYRRAATGGESSRRGAAGHQAQRQLGWQAQLGLHAQPAGWGLALACWQPQVQDAPGQLTQLQTGVGVVCMDSSVR